MGGTPQLEAVTNLGIHEFLPIIHPSFHANSPAHHQPAKKTVWRGKPKPWLPLHWNMKCQAVFEKLKYLFSAEQVLKHPDPKWPFVIHTDASDVAVGAVLFHRNQEGNLQPCAYTTCKLSKAEWRWAVWEKEMFTVRWAFLTWRRFLEGSEIPFNVWMDHKNLEAL